MHSGPKKESFGCFRTDCTAFERILLFFYMLYVLKQHCIYVTNFIEVDMVRVMPNDEKIL